MEHLVRHADAGDKQNWTGPDDERPLTSAGHLQARGMVTQLGGQPVTAIISSPALRCVQTVEPLAAHCRLPVRTDARLGVDGDPDEVVRLLLAGVGDDAVWCTHGELISQVLALLRGRGAPLGDRPDTPKGSTWQLEVADGTVVSATYLPPPLP